MKLAITALFFFFCLSQSRHWFVLFSKTSAYYVGQLRLTMALALIWAGWAIYALIAAVSP